MASAKDEALFGDFQHSYWRAAAVLRDELAPLSGRDIPEDEFKLLADNIPTLCWIANGDGYIVWYNRRWHDYCGTTPDDMEGWGWQSVHDADCLPEVMERWTHSIATGEPFEMTFPLKGADGIFRPFLTRVQPVRDAAGDVVRWFGVNTEVAAQHAAEHALRESEERLRIVQAAGRIGSVDYDIRLDTAICSDEWYQIYGLPVGSPIKLARMSSVIAPEDWPRVTDALERAIAERKPVDIEYRIVRPDTGELRWLQSSATMLLDRDGEPWRYVGGVVDITERKLAEATLLEESRTLETLNRTGSALAAELDLERFVQMVTDAGVELTGAKFGAFFYNVLDQSGEKYLLYSLSGAERSDFDRFGMPRATAIFHPTFMGEGVVRSDDITADPRYGKNDPHFGMPKGHLPVRSYLAVPVIGRSDEVLGGLFFGHPEVARFTERQERLITGIAAQAAVGIDNAKLYDAAQKDLAERKRAEAALRELNETLEQRVHEEIEQRSQAEEALRQSQKMETVGQLTGGIAHDFNNLLQIVSGNLDILCRRMPEEAAPLRRYAERAMIGAERAATLTQRLLAFSRRQPLAPKPTDVNRLLPAMSELLHRTLGETIEVEAVLPPRVWQVEADQNQLENAILNLAVNARDAMPEGGKLTIETQNTHLDEVYAAQNPGVVPGQYVVICISDTGVGMNAETAAKAVEPFFTTKEVGKGTGLGLSMVYGFIKQSGGHLKIYSEPGEGTTVKIYLPRLIGGVAHTAEPDEEMSPAASGEESILVCEDDEEVRAYSGEVLRELGYRVLEAADGDAALALLRNNDTQVNLLFTDVVLPGGMSGAQLAREAVALRPGLKTLFTTGYARNAIVHHGRLDPGVQLITKPFSYADLAGRIRDVLDKAD